MSLQRLMDPHQVREARLAVTPDPAEISGLPAGIGSLRQIEQRRGLIVSDAPETEEVDRRPEHGRGFLVCDRVGREGSWFCINPGEHRHESLVLFGSILADIRQMARTAAGGAARP